MIGYAKRWVPRPVFCRARGCEANTDYGEGFCPAHLAKIPKHLRDAISDALAQRHHRKKTYFTAAAVRFLEGNKKFKRKTLITKNKIKKLTVG